MAISGSVTQINSGKTLRFTDTSTDIVVTTRQLVIKDALGTILDTINMGGSTTYDYAIATDVLRVFILTINGSQSVTVKYMSTFFYDLQALKINSKLDCCSAGKNFCTDAVKAELSKGSAVTYYTFGQDQEAQELITAANKLIAVPKNCSC